MADAKRSSLEVKKLGAAFGVRLIPEVGTGGSEWCCVNSLQRGFPPAWMFSGSAQWMGSASE